MEISRIIHSPARAVWNILVDTEKWPMWGPSVEAVSCSDRYIHRQSMGRIKTPIGIWVGFTITDFVENTYWSWRVAGVPATGHRVKELDSHHCRLVFELPLLAAPYGVVCNIAINRIAAHLQK